MNEIICPHCQKAFKIDEAGYADILKQVRDHQFEEEMNVRLENAAKEKEAGEKLLAAQFESFTDPFIIMITVPLAIAGALLSLWTLDQTLNIFSQIGIIMLIGLVTKNGILIVEFANKKRETGLAIKEAVLEAATQRLRPILMTSLATALGALPIAISLGAAATSRKALGTVVVGGLLFSLVLTLFVIPSVYTYLSSKHKKQID